MSDDIAAVLERIKTETAFLKANPHFAERPATLLEFLGEGYLQIEDRVRDSIKKELEAIFGAEVMGDRMARYPLAMITGGIGIGKTTVASIVLPYMAHWVLCLKDPQGYYGLLPGSRIAFMQMSTSEKQALEVVFGDIKARIQYAPWFVNNYPYDTKFTTQIRFAKDIWILPGDSAETTFEGYNILGGILDEMDSHKVTEKKDYADQGYDTISNRISSRFGDRGFFLLIGQMKKGTGFAARKYADFKAREDAYVARMAIWDSFGDNYDLYKCKLDGPHLDNPENPTGQVCGQVHKFAYDTKRKEIVSDALAEFAKSETVIWIPVLYKREFETNPEKALRDLAGIPPMVGDPFISLVYKIEECRDRWVARHSGEVTTPLRPDGRFEDWFRCNDSLKRVGHVDIAYSGDGDALGFAMGHVREVVEIDGEMKPYIVFDLLMRVKAPSGGEIFLANIRQQIYKLRDDFGFKLKRVTLDGFQSTDWRQQMARRRFETDIVSVDKDLLPYHDLREAIYEDRLEFPKYMVNMKPGESELVEIAVKELSELVDAGRKIDHPEDGSKDVADAMAGVVFTLMGDRSYRRKVVQLGAFRNERAEMQATGTGGIHHPAMIGDSGLRAPLPPTWR